MATIRQKSSDNFQVIIRVTGFKPEYKTFNTKRKATAYGKKRESELKELRDTPIQANVLTAAQAEITVTECIEIYVREHNAFSRGYLHADQYLERRWLGWLKSMGNPLVINFTPQHINSYKQFRSEISTSTQRKELGYLQRALTYIRRDRGIAIPDVFQFVRKPKECKPRDNLVPDASFDLIIAELHGKPLIQAALKFLRLTAARRSEVSKLEWQYVNIKQRTVRFVGTKNGEDRVVVIPEQACHILADMMARGHSRKVFNVTADQITKAWVKVRNNLSLGDIRVHDLRRTRITELAASGLSAQQVAAVSGHKSLNLMNRVYTNITAEQMREYIK